ncbi:hypothetical protein V6N13_120424 [Hibiscus sabdariffa]
MAVSLRRTVCCLSSPSSSATPSSPLPPPSNSLNESIYQHPGKSTTKWYPFSIILPSSITPVLKNSDGSFVSSVVRPPSEQSASV